MRDYCPRPPRTRARTWRRDSSSASGLTHVAYQHERVRIERRGGRPVFLVSEEDVRVLEELEDRYWGQGGRKALAEFKRAGGKAVPWEKVRERLRLRSTR